MAKEEVILDFKVEQGEAIQELEQTKKAILSLKEEQQKLNKAYKANEITQEQYAKGLVKVEGELRKSTKAYSENLKAVTDTRTKFDQLVDSLSSSVPGFAGVQGGFSKITAGAKAFIATPIGIVVAALGAAISALTAYFKGSEEGQNDWNKVVKVGTVVLGNLLDIVRDFGSVLVKFFSGDLTGAAEAMGEAWDKTKNIVSETIDEINKGLSIEDLRAETDVLERELIVLRAINEAKIADLKLKAEDKSLGLEERQNALNEALRLQNELSDKSVEVAQNRLTIKQEENKLSDSTKEDLKEEAELQASLALVEKDRADKSKEIVTKNQALKQEGIAILEKERQAIVDLHNAEILREASEEQARIKREIEHQKELERINQRIQAWESEESIMARRIANLDLESDLVDEATDANYDYGQELGKINKLKTEQARNEQVYQNAVLSSFVIAEQVAGKSKASASALTAISTYFAAQKAFESQFLPVPDPSSPIRGSIAAAVAIAGGLARLAQINGITAAAGGGSFETRGPQLMVVGDNPGGRERVDVTPISGRGQTRVGRGMIQMAGGGSIVANSSSSRIDTSFGGILKDMNLTVSWREGQDLGNKVKFKEDLVTL